MFDSLLSSIDERKKEKMNQQKGEDLKIINEKFPGAITDKSGLMYVVTQQGSGESPKQGHEITVHYTGKLVNDKVFDSSVKRNEPFEFMVGVHEVIEGWDIAFQQMKKGEKRTLIIPPELGYGSRGAAGIIPPNAWLIFDVELIDFK